MYYWWLVFIFVICAIGAFLTYSPKYRVVWWAPIAIGVLSLAGGVLWGFVNKYIDDDKERYIFSAWWDIVIFAVYYILPVFFVELKLSPLAWFGVVLIFVGAGLIKLG